MKYRPSNGSEGVWFTERFCDKCIYNFDVGCPILIGSMLYEIDDIKYPNQLVLDPDPNCISFVEKRNVP